MKILTLMLLALSTQAFAHDWQYSIKYPDGKVVNKRLSNTENFMFPVRDYICTVNPLESDNEDEQNLYEVNCLSKTGVHETFDMPAHNVASETINIEIPEGKKKIELAITCFNYFADKKDRPFIHQAN